jgi:DNA-binding transcriptional MerR regulator
MARNDRLLTVGELATQVGKSPRALRLYEELGLLVPRCRSEGGFRQYGPESVARLQWIQQMTDLGLPLTEIREILDQVGCTANGGEAMGIARTHFRQRLAEVEDQLQRLTALRDGLQASLGYLERCQGCPETVLPVRCCDCERQEGARAPELVTGMLASPDPIQLGTTKSASGLPEPSGENN